MASIERKMLIATLLCCYLDKGNRFSSQIRRAVPVWRYQQTGSIAVTRDARRVQHAAARSPIPAFCNFTRNRHMTLRRTAESLNSFARSPRLHPSLLGNRRGNECPDHYDFDGIIHDKACPPLRLIRIVVHSRTYRRAGRRNLPG